jgi:hypothetical protein
MNNTTGEPGSGIADPRRAMERAETTCTSHPLAHYTRFVQNCKFEDVRPENAWLATQSLVESLHAWFMAEHCRALGDEQGYRRWHKRYALSQGEVYTLLQEARP